MRAKIPQIVFIFLLALAIWFIALRLYPNPNVILITCDTLRADHLQTYGYPRDNSQNIDALSKTSFVFENAYSQSPCTRPSVWSILSSRYQPKMPLDPNTLTITKYLKSNRYSTAAFVAQHYLKKGKSNLELGFDTYDDNFGLDHHQMTTRTAAEVVDPAMEWLSSNYKKRFFLWLHFFDPHDPYMPPVEFRNYYNKNADAKFDGDRRALGIHYKKGAVNKPISPEYRQFLINAYDEEIRYFDYNLGKFFDYLKERGLYDRSLIIVTADHGEELGDNGNLWDHCQSLSDEEIHVPLLIKLPGQKNSIRVVSPAQTIDVFPTIVSLIPQLKFGGQNDAHLEGVSLKNTLEHPNETGHTYAASFWEKKAYFTSQNVKYWRNNLKEAFQPMDAAKEKLDSVRRKLDLLIEKYIKNKIYYKKETENLKSLGYLQ